MSSEIKVQDCRNGCGASICFNGTVSSTGKQIPQEVDPYTLEIIGAHSCPKSAYAQKQASAPAAKPQAPRVAKPATPAPQAPNNPNAVSQLAALREIAVNTRALPEMLALLKKMHPDIVNEAEQEDQQVE